MAALIVATQVPQHTIPDPDQCGLAKRDLLGWQLCKAAYDSAALAVAVAERAFRRVGNAACADQKLQVLSRQLSDYRRGARGKPRYPDCIAAIEYDTAKVKAGIQKRCLRGIWTELNRGRPTCSPDSATPSPDSRPDARRDSAPVQPIPPAPPRTVQPSTISTSQVSPPSVSRPEVQAAKSPPANQGGMAASQTARTTRASARSPRPDRDGRYWMRVSWSKTTEQQRRCIAAAFLGLEDAHSVEEQLAKMSKTGSRLVYSTGVSWVTETAGIVRRCGGAVEFP